MREKDIRLTLKDISSNKPSLAVIKYKCSDGLLTYSTGQKIEPRRFKKNQFHSALQDRFTMLRNTIKDYIKIQEKADRLVKKDLLYNHLISLEDNGKKLRKVTDNDNKFYEQLQSLIDEAKTGNLHTGNNKRNYSSGTVVHWQLTVNKLKEFNPNLSWDITMKDYDEFLTWCKEKGFQPNYIGGTLVKTWKHLANRGLEKGWHTNVTHLNPNFKKLTEKVKKEYLNDEEIQKIIDLKLTGMQKIIRDCFIIGLNTGLRISDLRRLRKEDYKGGIITIRNQKTDVETAIPANGDVRRIIASYGNDFPYVPGTNKWYVEIVMNREIKKICALAGINEMIKVIKTKGATKEITMLPKSQLISTHTCRRSFVTNKLKIIPAIEVAAYVGSTLRNMEHYKKETVQELAKRKVGSLGFE